MTRATQQLQVLPPISTTITEGDNVVDDCIVTDRTAATSARAGLLDQQGTATRTNLTTAHAGALIT
jgi:hypothetical protein